ncbi:TetR family transcriptional regulator, partial [Saccharopolyspora sp. NPDC002686]
FRRPSAMICAKPVYNHILRQWLKSGGALDAKRHLREAIEQVAAALNGRRSAVESTAAEGESVVVGVVRTAAPTDVVLKQLEDALRELR